MQDDKPCQAEEGTYLICIPLVCLGLAVVDQLHDVCKEGVGGVEEMRHGGMGNGHRGLSSCCRVLRQRGVIKGHFLHGNRLRSTKKLKTYAKRLFDRAASSEIQRWITHRTPDLDWRAQARSGSNPTHKSDAM
jgi:hypothetical protein